MPAHNELTKYLDLNRKTHASTGAASSQITAANATLDARELRELIDTAAVNGYAVSLVAGAVKIDPRA